MQLFTFENSWFPFFSPPCGYWLWMNAFTKHFNDICHRCMCNNKNAIQNVPFSAHFYTGFYSIDQWSSWQLNMRGPCFSHVGNYFLKNTNLFLSRTLTHCIWKKSPDLLASCTVLHEKPHQWYVKYLNQSDWNRSDYRLKLHDFNGSNSRWLICYSELHVGADVIKGLILVKWAVDASMRNRK